MSVTDTGFTIQYAPRSPEPFGPYNYDIYRGDVCVVRFWHDYRGDEHGIVFADGTVDDDPIGGRTIDFLQGGGPLPLRLSEAAVRSLTRTLGPGT